MKFSIVALEAAGLTHKQGDLRILGDDKVQHLYKRADRNLWAQVGDAETLEDCKRLAREQFQVDEDSWVESETPADDYMKAYALKAIEMAHDKYGIDLDFSEESLKAVELLFKKMHKERHSAIARRLLKKRDPIAEQMDFIMKSMGGYIAEVIGRNIQRGDWRLDEERYPGESILTFRVGETDMYPPMKVFKRLRYGRDDNIRNYYDRVKKMHKDGKL